MPGNLMKAMGWTQQLLRLHEQFFLSFRGKTNTMQALGDRLT